MKVYFRESKFRIWYYF